MEIGNIIEKSRDFSKIEMYKLMEDPDNISAKNAVGLVLEVDGFMIFDKDSVDRATKQPTTTRLLALSNPAPALITASPTLMKSFAKMWAVFGDEVTKEKPLIVEVMSGKTANGDTYYDVKLLHFGFPDQQ